MEARPGLGGAPVIFVRCQKSLARSRFPFFQRERREDGNEGRASSSGEMYSMNQGPYFPLRISSVFLFSLPFFSIRNVIQMLWDSWRDLGDALDLWG